MPLAIPNKGEDEKSFLSRCMKNKVMRREFPDNDQRSAVCYKQWRKHRIKERIKKGG